MAPIIYDKIVVGASPHRLRSGCELVFRSLSLVWALIRRRARGASVIVIFRYKKGARRNTLSAILWGVTRGEAVWVWLTRCAREVAIAGGGGYDDLR